MSNLSLLLPLPLFGELYRIQLTASSLLGRSLILPSFPWHTPHPPLSLSLFFSGLIRRLNSKVERPLQHHLRHYTFITTLATARGTRLTHVGHCQLYCRLRSPPDGLSHLLIVEAPCEWLDNAISAFRPFKYYPSSFLLIFRGLYAGHSNLSQQDVEYPRMSEFRGRLHKYVACTCLAEALNRATRRFLIAKKNCIYRGVLYVKTLYL